MSAISYTDDITRALSAINVSLKLAKDGDTISQLKRHRDCLTNIAQDLTVDLLNEANEVFEQPTIPGFPDVSSSIPKGKE